MLRGKTLLAAGDIEHHSCAVVKDQVQREDDQSDQPDDQSQTTPAKPETSPRDAQDGARNEPGQASGHRRRGARGEGVGDGENGGSPLDPGGAPAEGSQQCTVQPARLEQSSATPLSFSSL